MRKVSRILIPIFLVFSLLCNLIPSYALDLEPIEPPVIPEDYVHLQSVSATISVSSGVARVSSSGRVSGGSDTVYVTVKLQRMSNYTWTTLKTWSSSGVGHCLVSATWNVVPGYTYRNFTTVTVYTSSGSYVETVYKTSSQFY